MSAKGVFCYQLYITVFRLLSLIVLSSSFGKYILLKFNESFFGYKMPRSIPEETEGRRHLMVLRAGSKSQKTEVEETQDQKNPAGGVAGGAAGAAAAGAVTEAATGADGGAAGGVDRGAADGGAVVGADGGVVGRAGKSEEEVKVRTPRRPSSRVSHSSARRSMSMVSCSSAASRASGEAQLSATLKALRVKQMERNMERDAIEMHEEEELRRQKQELE